MAYHKVDETFPAGSVNPIPASERVDLELLLRYQKMAESTLPADRESPQLERLLLLWASNMHDKHVATVNVGSSAVEQALVYNGVNSLKTLASVVSNGGYVDLSDRIIVPFTGEVIDMKYIPGDAEVVA